MYGVVITARLVRDGEAGAEELHLGDFSTWSQVVASLNTLPFEPVRLVIMRDIKAHDFAQEMGGELVEPEDIAMMNRASRRARQ